MSTPILPVHTEHASASLGALAALEGQTDYIDAINHTMIIAVTALTTKLAQALEDLSKQMTQQLATDQQNENAYYAEYSPESPAEGWGAYMQKTGITNLFDAMRDFDQKHSSLSQALQGFQNQFDLDQMQGQNEINVQQKLVDQWTQNSSDINTATGNEYKGMQGPLSIGKNTASCILNAILKG